MQGQEVINQIVDYLESMFVIPTENENGVLISKCRDFGTKKIETYSIITGIGNELFEKTIIEFFEQRVLGFTVKLSIFFNPVWGNTTILITNVYYFYK